MSLLRAALKYDLCSFPPDPPSSYPEFLKKTDPGPRPTTFFWTPLPTAERGDDVTDVAIRYRSLERAPGDTPFFDLPSTDGRIVGLMNFPHPSRSPFPSPGELLRRGPPRRAAPVVSSILEISDKVLRKDLPPPSLTTLEGRSSAPGRHSVQSAVPISARPCLRSLFLLFVETFLFPRPILKCGSSLWR